MQPPSIRIDIAPDFSDVDFISLPKEESTRDSHSQFLNVYARHDNDEHRQTLEANHYGTSPDYVGLDADFRNSAYFNTPTSTLSDDSIHADYPNFDPNGLLYETTPYLTQGPISAVSSDPVSPLLASLMSMDVGNSYSSPVSPSPTPFKSVIRARSLSASEGTVAPCQTWYYRGTSTPDDMGPSGSALWQQSTSSNPLDEDVASPFNTWGNDMTASNMSGNAENSGDGSNWEGQITVCNDDGQSQYLEHGPSIAGGYVDDALMLPQLQSPFPPTSPAPRPGLTIQTGYDETRGLPYHAGDGPSNRSSLSPASAQSGRGRPFGRFASHSPSRRHSPYPSPTSPSASECSPTHIAGSYGAAANMKGSSLERNLQKGRRAISADAPASRRRPNLHGHTQSLMIGRLGARETFADQPAQDPYTGEVSVSLSETEMVTALGGLSVKPEVKLRVASEKIVAASASRRMRPATFLCDICSAVFTAKHNLDNHIRSHRGERNFGCPCGRSFTTTSVLSRHKKKCLRGVEA